MMEKSVWTYYDDDLLKQIKKIDFQVTVLLRRPRTVSKFYIRKML